MVVPLRRELAPSIVDQFGRPYRAPVDPLTGRDAKATAGQVFRDLPIQTLIEDWPYERVRAALVGHALGRFHESSIMADAIMGDDRVHAALGSRVGALFGLPLVYSASTSRNVDATAAEDVRAAWAEAFPMIMPRSTASENKRWSHMAGFSLSEILWDTSVTPWRPFLKPWHPQHVWYDWLERCIKANTQDGPVTVTPGDGRWFVHAPHGLYRGWMQGAVRPLALPWLLRNFASRDWARYNERHGLPILIAEVPAMARAEDKDAFGEALSNMGQESVIVAPQNIDGTGFDVRMLEAMDRAWESFKAVHDRSDTAVVLTLQWQNLTTEVKEGSFAAARVHGDVKQSALEFDNAGWSYDVYWQIARPWALFNHGNADLAPYTSHDVEPLEDIQTALTGLTSFAAAVTQLRTAAVPFDIAKLAAAYNVRITINETTSEKVAQIFAYHLTSGIVSVNEVRTSLGLRPTGRPEDDIARPLGPGEAAGAITKEAA